MTEDLKTKLFTFGKLHWILFKLGVTKSYPPKINSSDVVAYIGRLEKVWP